MPRINQIISNSLGVKFQLEDGEVSEQHLNDSAISTRTIQENAVTQTKIASNAVGTGELIDSSITTSKIANSGVHENNIADNAVTQRVLATSSVGTSELIDGSVTSEKIANGAVGASQIDGSLLNSPVNNAAVQAEFDLRGVNVMKIGAKGDGITDDTASLQAAIDYVAGTGGGIVLLLSKTYAINTGSIVLKSNVRIVGQGATITTNSSATTKTLFIDQVGTVNIEISGIHFISTNDKTREIGRLGLGSNINGVRLANTIGATFRNLSFDSLEFGLKIDNCQNIEIQNITSIRTQQPLYTSGSTVIRADSLNLDCSHQLDSQDHSVYANSGTVDARFNNVTLTGSAGHAIVVKTDGFDRLDTSDVTFTGLTLNNVFGGISTFNNVKNCRFSNITGTSLKSGGSWFRTAYGNDNIVFENFIVAGGCLNLWSNQPDTTGLTGSVIIRNGELTGQSDQHIFVPNNIAYLEISNFTAHRAQPTDASSRIFYASATWTNTTVVIKNCTFKYMTVPTAQPISARSNGTVIITECKFLNLSGTSYSALIYNLTPAKVQFSKNQYYGFTSVVATADTSAPVCYYNEDIENGNIRIIGNRRQVFDSAAPTTGIWTVGDVIWNTVPAASGYMGWTCTTAGTPGTWKGFGQIQA